MLTNTFIKKLTNDSKLNIENLVILTCAIFIASIGLNMNSTATSIGAMLISPLMSPLLAIGTGLAIYDIKLIKNGSTTILVEIIISLLASTSYFFFSPLSYASKEIIARTSPTIWDVMIAFFGGVAGIIGASKKEATNIVPGVAIATALMPPLCTVGYGIASHNLTFFLGASYLFLINAVFIILTAFLGVKAMRYLSHANNYSTSFFRLPTRKEFFFIIAILSLTIPSIFSAKQMVQQSIIENNVHKLVASEFADSLVIKEDIDNQNKTINLTISGSKENSQKIKRIKKRLTNYNLKDYSLNVIQVAQLNAATETQLNNQVTSIINRQRQTEDEKNKRRLIKQNKQNKKIAKLSHNINSVTSVSDTNNNHSIIVELHKKINREQKEQLTIKIKKNFPHIDKIEYVLEDS